MQILKKMSIGAINGVRKGFKDVKETRFVARIMGIAQSVQVEDGALGTYRKFTGEFKGINADGEEFVSAVCYLPAPVDSLLASHMASNDGAAVNFAFDISIAPNDSPIGYEYVVSTLLETKPSNPLAELMSKVAPLQIAAKPKQAELPGVDGKRKLDIDETIAKEKTEAAKSLGKKSK
jgi:hypothetical protein